MSGLARFASEYGSLVAPEALEIGTRVAVNADQRPQKPRIPRVARIRKPRNTFNPALPGGSAMSKQNPTPAEVQASLDKTLADFVENQRTPEDRGRVLIKIGMYKTELAKYLPIIQATGDDEFTDHVLSSWFDEGDEELKKMVLNCESGQEEVPLAKAEVLDEGVTALVKMVDDAPEGPVRIAVLQKIGHYTAELRNLLDRIHEQPDEKQVELIKVWVMEGDGTHFDLKKAVVSAEQAMRAQASATVGEKAAVDEVVGNASTHAQAALGGSADSPDAGIKNTVPSRSSSAGAGRHMRGNVEPPDQDSSSGVDVSSGTDESNGAATVRPRSKIRRKGTTGGLGSVRGAEDNAGTSLETAGANDAGQNLTAQDRTEKMAKMRDVEIDDLGLEMLKIAPEPLIAAVEGLTEDDQVLVVEELGQHAADLMAWSDHMGNQLQKRDLDAAIADWLSADADSIQLKKWCAEALGTAEEIPLDMAKAIMAWKPPATTAQPRVRQAA